MNETVETIDTIYPPELLKGFPRLSEQLATYHAFVENLERTRGTAVVNLQTPRDVVEDCARKLQQVAKSMREGILTGSLNPESLYLLATKPAKSAGELKKLPPDRQVGIIPGKHYYFALKRERMSAADALPSHPPSYLLTLLQRVPFGMDTEPEIHGITPDFNPAPYGGIEVYLPLVDGIDFFVNRGHIQPKTLETLVTVLPGDVHHHVKNTGTGPARVLILGGFGFTYGVKTADTQFIVPGFDKIDRFTPLK